MDRSTDGCDSLHIGHSPQALNIVCSEFAVPLKVLITIWDVPKVTLNVSEAVLDTSGVAINVSAVTVDVFEVTRDTSEVTVNASEVTADVLEVTLNTSRATADVPEVTSDAFKSAAAVFQGTVRRPDHRSDAPRRDGNRVVLALHPPLRRLRGITMSRYADERQIEEMPKTGSPARVTRPYDVGTLVETIRKAVAATPRPG